MILTVLVPARIRSGFSYLHDAVHRLVGRVCEAFSADLGRTVECHAVGDYAAANCAGIAQIGPSGDAFRPIGDARQSLRLDRIEDLRLDVDRIVRAFRTVEPDVEAIASRHRADAY